jgi:hypothetical protein
LTNMACGLIMSRKPCSGITFFPPQFLGLAFSPATELDEETHRLSGHQHHFRFLV